MLKHALLRSLLRPPHPPSPISHSFRHPPQTPFPHSRPPAPPPPRRSFCLQRDSAALPTSASSSAPSSSIGLGRPFLAQFYLRMLAKHPVLTKSVTAATIYFFADITSQGISNWQSGRLENVEWDMKRTARMFATGLFLSGPTLHLWFSFVSRTLPNRDLVSTMKKLTLGQLIYGPTFTVVFFSLNALVQGESLDEIKSRLKRDFPRTIKSGLMYWPACDFITYRYAPVHLQPLVSNSFSFLWTIYLTYMACLKKVELECQE